MARAAHAFELASDEPSTARIDIHLRVVLATGQETEPMEGVVVNIAPDGLLVQAPVTPPHGSQVSFSFRMLANRVCEARGQVVRHGEEGFEIALEERSADMNAFLRELLKLPSPLRPIYLADVLHPRLEIF